MKIDFKEVEWFALVCEIMGVMLFVVGLCWDSIVGVQVNHGNGIGIAQLAWMSFWGLFTFWAYMIRDRIKDYQNKIHRFIEDEFKRNYYRKEE